MYYASLPLHRNLFKPLSFLKTLQLKQCKIAYNGTLMDGIQNALLHLCSSCFTLSISLCSIINMPCRTVAIDVEIKCQVKYKLVAFSLQIVSKWIRIVVKNVILHSSERSWKKNNNDKKIYICIFSVSQEASVGEWNCLLSVSLSTCLPAAEGLDWTEVIELTEPWGSAFPGGTCVLFLSLEVGRERREG